MINKVKINKYKSIVIFLIRLFIGSLFFLSGTLKLFEINKFNIIVAKFNIIPINLVPIFSIALILSEIICGLFLIIGIYIKISSYVLILMNISFIIAISINIIRGNIIDCGCFGRLFSEKIGWRLLFRDFILLGLLLCILSEKKFIYSIQKSFKSK